MPTYVPTLSLRLPSLGLQFEKKHGDRAGIEDVLVSKRRQAYEEQVAENPHNYDAWFDYVRLEESHADIDKIRDVYERAIANVPPARVCSACGVSMRASSQCAACSSMATMLGRRSGSPG